MSDHPRRFALGLAYQHGRDPMIKAGLDGAVDYISEHELELAAHAFLAKGQPVINIFHTDGTEGHARVVESYLHRGPDWPTTDIDGKDVVIKSGDWLFGAIFDEASWRYVEAGLISGWSPEGVATRRTKKKIKKSEQDTIGDALALARAGYTYADLANALAAKAQLIDASTRGETR